jgi:hypothetical protein
MKFFTRITLALLMTVTVAFAEEPISIESADSQNAIQTESTGEIEAAEPAAPADPLAATPEVELASAEAASTSETVSLSPAPWSETMGSLRTGGVPEGQRSPNELQDVSWTNNHLVIGAGALIVILLIIILVA